MRKPRYISAIIMILIAIPTLVFTVLNFTCPEPLSETELIRGRIDNTRARLNQALLRVDEQQQQGVDISEWMLNLNNANNLLNQADHHWGLDEYDEADDLWNEAEAIVYQILETLPPIAAPTPIWVWVVIAICVIVGIAAIILIFG